jgi:protein-disulfide isomerase
MSETGQAFALEADAQLDASRVAPVTPEDHIYGPPDAAVTLIEYGEFECPVCGRAHHQLKALRERLDDLGARFVFRHLARDDVHPFSVRAAVTSEAADRQGKFWEMHDHLFEHQHSLEDEDLIRHATAVGLDVDRFRAEVRDPELLARVTIQGEAALGAGVGVTPTFFLNGKHYDGAHDVASLIEAIERESRS